MILLALGGCMTLDFMFYGGDARDTPYVLESELIPAANIERDSFLTADGLELQGAWAWQDDPEADVVVYFHGKGRDIEGQFTHRVEPLWSLGYSVYIFDYRGYGLSEGSQEGQGILEEDGLAAVEHVIEVTGREPEELYWYGLSLGGAVASHTTDELPARALVLESVFAGTDYMVDGSIQLDLPDSWFVGATADNAEALRQAQAPVYVIHGLADDFVDPSSGLVLFDAAPEPKQLWRPEGVGHDDLVEQLPEAFAENVGTFFRSH